jgi:hypothetical protein
MPAGTAMTPATRPVMPTEHHADDPTTRRSGPFYLDISGHYLFARHR